MQSLLHETQGGPCPSSLQHSVAVDAVAAGGEAAVSETFHALLSHELSSHPEGMHSELSDKLKKGSQKS